MIPRMREGTAPRSREAFVFIVILNLFQDPPESDLRKLPRAAAFCRGSRLRVMALTLDPAARDGACGAGTFS